MSTTVANRRTFVRDTRRGGRRQGLEIGDQEGEIGIRKVVSGHRRVKVPARRVYPIANCPREGLVGVHGPVFRSPGRLPSGPYPPHLLGTVERGAGHGPHPRAAFRGSHPAAPVAVRAGGHGTRKGDAPRSFAPHLHPGRKDPFPVHPHPQGCLGRSVRRIGKDGREDARHGGEERGEEERGGDTPRVTDSIESRRPTGHRAPIIFRVSTSRTSACTIPSILTQGSRGDRRRKV